MSGFSFFTCCNVNTVGTHEMQCPANQGGIHHHRFYPTHNHGEDGKHYCPTGFEECSCGAVRHIDSSTCVRWGI